MKILAAGVGILSTTLGQSLLLHLLFPLWMAGAGFWVILSLLIFNCGVAALMLFAF